MKNIKKQYKELICPVINNTVRIEFQVVLVEDTEIGPYHMRGCDSMNSCEVIDTQPNAIQSFKWAKCPIYLEYP